MAAGADRVRRVRPAQGATGGRAPELAHTRKALLAQKVEKYMVDQKGKQTKIEEQQMSGLSITADERTNSIIAKGVRMRIDRVREAIALLDVPADRGVRVWRGDSGSARRGRGVAVRRGFRRWV